MQSEPKKNDAVLGGQSASLVGSFVLGGLPGVKQRLSNPHVRGVALFESLRYGELGIELIKQALRNERLKWAAFSILYAYELGNQDLLNSLEQRYLDNNNNSVKNHLAQELKRDLEVYSGAMVGTDFPIPGAEIVDIAAVFPTGYVIAFIVQLNPITPTDLAKRTTLFLEAGADVIWCLGKSANTKANKDWFINNYGFAYFIDTTPAESDKLNLFSLTKYQIKNAQYAISKIKWQLDYEGNEVNRAALLQELADCAEILENGTPANFDGWSILARALRQTFHTWRRLSNVQLRRGLLLQNQGLKSLGGFLGGLNSHNHHTRLTAIDKQPDGYWIVTDDEQLRGSYINLNRMFTENGVNAMKKLAQLMATLMPVSQ